MFIVYLHFNEELQIQSEEQEVFSGSNSFAALKETALYNCDKSS